MFYKFETLNKVLLPNIMRMIYCAIAQSNFSYGIAILGGAYDTHFKITYFND